MGDVNYVLSIPHSGTRNLRKQLGGVQLHFFEPRAHLARLVADHIDIPVRYPTDVAVSWTARYDWNDGRSIPPFGNTDMMVQCYSNMFWWLDGGWERKEDDIDIDIWPIEMFPRDEESRGPDHSVRVTHNSRYVDAVWDYILHNPRAYYFFQFFYEHKMAAEGRFPKWGND